MSSVEIEREKKRNYMRKWRSENPNKIKDTNRKHYSSNRDEYREQARKYRAANQDKIRESERERSRERRTANPEKVRQYHREYQRRYRSTKPDKCHEYSRKYRSANLDKVRKSVRMWQTKHPEVMRANAKKRRASLMTSVSNAPTVEQLAILMKDPCVYCGEQAEHMDHVIPLARGGTHELDNLVPSCKACNLSKGYKLPVVEWTGRRK